MVDRLRRGLINSCFILLAAFGLTTLSNLLFVGFLPSLDWIRVTNAPSNALATLALIVTFGFLAFHFREIFAAFPRFKALVVIIVGPVLAWLVAFATPTFTVPFIVTLVAGSPSEQRFWVKDLPSYHKYCRNAVALREFEMMGRICGLSDDIRDRLYPGAVIVVTGRATSLGIFVQDVRIPW